MLTTKREFMPKLNYGCNHCIDRFDTYKEAYEHEQECDFNPAAQGCYTCCFFVGGLNCSKGIVTNTDNTDPSKVHYNFHSLKEECESW